MRRFSRFRALISSHCWVFHFSFHVVFFSFRSFSADSPSVQREAQERFQAHIENPKDGKALPSEYAVPVYKIVLKTGGQEQFDQVMGPTKGFHSGEREMRGDMWRFCTGKEGSQTNCFFGTPSGS